MTIMLNFSAILSDLQAAIAVRAACDRRLTVLLVAVWGRIARIRQRLERLIAQWRAGTLPKARASRAGQTRKITKRQPAFPRTAGWLLGPVQEAGAYGSQLQHLLSSAECAAFLAAVPQAGRILRPLLRMLVAGTAAVKRREAPPVWWAAEAEARPALSGLVLGPGGRFLYV